jgi:hypothetical protein
LSRLSLLLHYFHPGRLVLLLFGWLQFRKKCPTLPQWQHQFIPNLHFPKCSLPHQWHKRLCSLLNRNSWGIIFLGLREYFWQNSSLNRVHVTISSLPNSITSESFLSYHHRLAEKNSTNIDYELKNNYIKRLRAISNCSNSHNYTTNMHKLKFSKSKYNQTIVLHQ